MKSREKYLEDYQQSLHDTRIAMQEARTLLIAEELEPTPEAVAIIAAALMRKRGNG